VGRRDGRSNTRGVTRDARRRDVRVGTAGEGGSCGGACECTRGTARAPGGRRVDARPGWRAAGFRSDPDGGCIDAPAARARAALGDGAHVRCTRNARCSGVRVGTAGDGISCSRACGRKCTREEAAQARARAPRGRRVDGHLERRAAGSRTLRIWIRGGGDSGLAQPQDLPQLRSDGVVHLALRELPRLRGQRRRGSSAAACCFGSTGALPGSALGGDGDGGALLRLIGGGVLLRLERRRLARPARRSACCSGCVRLD